MAKNMTLCSDGTGNKGGTGSDTKVFKLYHAIKGGPNKRDQISIYNNGVGTASFSVLRGIGGATGLGFRRNVRDLYEFASRHNKAGEDIYGFGFSRGAATIRAFASMVYHCGLVQRYMKDAEGNEIVSDEDVFQGQVDVAMASYVSRAGKSKPIREGRLKVNIEFLGLWDTVSALGFPQLSLLDSLVNLVRRHKFCDYQPTETVKHVFHAVAIDDERRTFWPMIWDETKFGDGQNIEQVWFPGMHSNFGGGYHFYSRGFTEFLRRFSFAT